MRLKEFKKELLTNKEFATFQGRKSLGRSIANMLFETRIKAGITQHKLAKLVNTKQPSIARIENGTQIPSLRFLEKIALSLGGELLPPEIILPSHNANRANSPSITTEIKSNTTDKIPVTYIDVPEHAKVYSSAININT